MSRPETDVAHDFPMIEGVEERFAIGFFNGTKIEWRASAEDIGGAVLARKTIWFEEHLDARELGIYDQWAKRWVHMPAFK